MRNLYAFCRLVDDIADEKNIDDSSRITALEEIRQWLKEGRFIGHPYWDAFLKDIQAFKIPTRSIEGIIDGVKMDIGENPIRFKTWNDLNQYVYGVACCVGECVLSILGATGPQAAEYSLEMGRCLQYLNIMRDIEEDYDQGRIYIPEELLQRENLGASEFKSSPQKLQRIRDEIYQRACEFRRLAIPYDWACLPAELMSAVYFRGSKKWRWGDSKRLTKLQKLKVALSAAAAFICKFKKV